MKIVKIYLFIVNLFVLCLHRDRVSQYAVCNDQSVSMWKHSPTLQLRVICIEEREGEEDKAIVAKYVTFQVTHRSLHEFSVIGIVKSVTKNL